MAKKPTNLDDFFDDDEEGEFPPLKPAMVRAAEKSLASISTVLSSVNKSDL